VGQLKNSVSVPTEHSIYELRLQGREERLLFYNGPELPANLTTTDGTDFTDSWDKAGFSWMNDPESKTANGREFPTGFYTRKQRERRKEESARPDLAVKNRK